MPNVSDVVWFKQQYGAEMKQAIVGTPLTVDSLVALACQETGEFWPVLRTKGFSAAGVAALCNGDTIDGKSRYPRKAFPTSKAELLAVSDGQRMFDIARRSLVDIGVHFKVYGDIAAKNSDKFCHGFGVFQRDIQFFKEPGEAPFFLNEQFRLFSRSLEKALVELKRGLGKLGLANEKALTDLQCAAVAICYNTGGFNPKLGLKQGYKNDAGKYYGEAFFDYLRLAHTVPTAGEPAVLAPPSRDFALLGRQPVADTAYDGPVMKVEVGEGLLRLRATPELTTPVQANVLAHLPAGQVVRPTGRKSRGRFIEVSTSLHGAAFRGYVAKKFLSTGNPKATLSRDTAVGVPLASGVPAVYAPRLPGSITKRSAFANALSLNEPKQPTRAGSTPDELRASIKLILDWLDPGDSSHARYWPRDSLTFCNVYAHDYCFLANVYLPRVWWKPKALMAIARGEKVEPLLGTTIEEQRANQLFSWLDEFGVEFGWRRASNLTELQTEVNQGAVGVVVARRAESARPGHVSVVVAETDEWRAKRDQSGAVTHVLQSQAGSKNFKYGTVARNWWLGAQFADFAFWLHA
ncbi:MAG: hypothetical protein NTW15_04175 [Burkholderiales bacterium]|nr:hypothetical protein [Burkholderiales bacterium]